MTGIVATVAILGWALVAILLRSAERTRRWNDAVHAFHAAQFAKAAKASTVREWRP